MGIIDLDGQQVDAAVLARMGEAMAHRGPDDEGCFIDESVGLFHKRLAIIDLETGHQPMTSGGVTIVFNGQIYNYVELKENLKSRGHSFDTTSDTEVILRMYIEHGEGCIKQLNGIFAFILYDPHRQLVLVARDHFGVKPLYYYKGSSQLLFASEIKALLQHGALDAQPDYDAIRDYFTFQYVLGSRTLFRGVRKLLPGHYEVISVKSGGERLVQYWEPNFSVDVHHTEQYFKSELRRLLEDAVRIQMRSDVPLGSHLSGGMDSSVIAILAAQGNAQTLHAFTGAFREGREYDETEYARAVAGANNIELHEIFPSEKDFVDLLPRLIHYMDEPAAGPGLFPQFMVSRMAAERVKVVLGGQGGDEIFGGYARYMVAYLEQALKGAILETNEEREHLVSLNSILPNLPYLRAYTPMLQKFWQQDVFEPMDRRYFRLLDRSGGTASPMSDDFQSQHCPDEVFARFQQVFNHPNTRSYYNKMTHFDMVAGLPALLHVEDRASMAVSLESRVPLLDHRIADLVTSMPPMMKFKGGEMKYIFKKTVSDLLPLKVLERKDKMGFPVPLHRWVKGRSGEFFVDVLLSTRTKARGLYNPKAVARLLSENRPFGREIWGLLCLELWHREFIDA